MGLAIMVFGNDTTKFVNGCANSVDSIPLTMCIACFMLQAVLLDGLQ
jgi:hypothetical protein